MARRARRSAAAAGDRRAGCSMPVQLVAPAARHASRRQPLHAVLRDAAAALHVRAPRSKAATVLVLAGVLAASCVLIANVIDTYADTPTDYLLTAGLVVAAPILLGRVLRHRSRLNRDAAREAPSGCERERAEQAEQAAAEEERTRIAGELHDVVAHAMSAMVVQAVRRPAARRARPGARRRGVPRRRDERPRGADRDPPPARRAAPRGRGDRARAAAVACATSPRSCASAQAAGLPVELRRRGRGARRCRPAST